MVAYPPLKIKMPQLFGPRDWYAASGQATSFNTPLDNVQIARMKNPPKLNIPQNRQPTAAPNAPVKNIANASTKNPLVENPPIGPGDWFQIDQFFEKIAKDPSILEPSKAPTSNETATFLSTARASVCQNPDGPKKSKKKKKKKKKVGNSETASTSESGNVIPGIVIPDSSVTRSASAWLWRVDGFDSQAKPRHS